MFDKLKLLFKSKADLPWFKYYGKMPKRLKYFEGSLYEYMENTAVKYPNYCAIEFFNKKMNYKTLLDEIDGVALSLIEDGVKENDIVTICMANSPEAVVAFYAVNKIGAVSNIIHPLSSENEIKNFIENTNSNVVFVSDILYDTMISICNDLKIKSVVVCPLSNKMDTVHKLLYNVFKAPKLSDLPENFILYNEYMTISLDACKTVHRNYDDDAVILYSGGTTGRPKGVVLSNLCFNSIPLQYSHVIEAHPGDSILSYLPIFHGFGLCVSIHTPLTYGMRCVLDPKIDVKKINNILKNKKINFLPVIPALLNVMIKDKTLSKNAFKNLRYIVSGGDFLSLELKQSAEKFVRNHGSNANIIVGYGLTEAMAAVCASIEPNYKSKSVGVPLPDNRYKVVKNDTHIPCDKNEVGEICLAGPSLMSRYYKNEEETFKTLQVHDDGILWLHTGDLGYVGDDDVLYFETRKKRVIISNGFNIYPNYIEEVLNKHPYVETSIVVGQKDKARAQVAKAVIVLKDDVAESEKVKTEIKDYLKENISKYAVPKIYEFTKELPKTKVGKVDFKALE